MRSLHVKQKQFILSQLFLDETTWFPCIMSWSWYHPARQYTVGRDQFNEPGLLPNMWHQPDWSRQKMACVVPTLINFFPIESIEFEPVKSTDGKESSLPSNFKSSNDYGGSPHIETSPQTITCCSCRKRRMLCGNGSRRSISARHSIQLSFPTAKLMPTGILTIGSPEVESHWGSWGSG